jgi:hypothetical protein
MLLREKLKNENTIKYSDTKIKNNILGNFSCLLAII